MRAALLVLLLVSSLATSGMASPARPKPVSDASDQMVTRLRQGGISLSRRHLQAAWVNRVGARLAQVPVAVAAGGGVDWKFLLVDDRLPLAYAPGEGIVVVSEGLLDLGLNDDELAGILAHEMAHRTQGHIIVESVPEANLRQLEEESARVLAERGRERRALEASREACTTRLLQLEQRAQQLQAEHATLTRTLEADRCSNHACELQADALGREHAAAAGYSPTGLESALRKLLRGCDSALTAESLTHPALARRIEILHGQSGTRPSGLGTQDKDR